MALLWATLTGFRMRQSGVASEADQSVARLHSASALDHAQSVWRQVQNVVVGSRGRSLHGG
ncbi:hypothetical protein PSEUDO9AG_41064 [Pseudomonas sp. 9Ag]|nr:hypothetical protein PSEUDO9AG_41064 [Pseudomonas sp. 9Ag]